MGAGVTEEFHEQIRRAVDDLRHIDEIWRDVHVAVERDDLPDGVERAQRRLDRAQLADGAPPCRRERFLQSFVRARLARDQSAVRLRGNRSGEEE